MKIYYSAKINGFVDDIAFAGKIPEDAVEISIEERNELIRKVTPLTYLTSDDNGYPIIKDREDKEEIQSKGVRTKRDYLLNESDWVSFRSMETGQPIPEEWLEYRQALRDVPQQEGFPKDIQWPVKPEVS